MCLKERRYEKGKRKKFEVFVTHVNNYGLRNIIAMYDVHFSYNYKNVLISERPIDVR